MYFRYDYIWSLKFQNSDIPVTTNSGVASNSYMLHIGSEWIMIGYLLLNVMVHLANGIGWKMKILEKVVVLKNKHSVKWKHQALDHCPY